MQNQIGTAVIIGRFQPFHHGHASLLRAALNAAPKVICILGSSFHARSAKNPFTWQERAAMIATTLSEEEKQRVSFIPIRDYYEDRRWADAVRKNVATQTEEGRQIALVGYFKDATNYYLNHFPQWKLMTPDKEWGIDATTIRKILFEAEDLDVSLKVIEGLAPRTVCQYLRAWAVLPPYRQLTEEHAKVCAYKAAWRTAPYTPIFSTVDALVKASEHILLIRRGDFPGKGLWALPGGFVEPCERLLQSALRELNEETKLAVLESSLENSLKDVKVFDHPDRSQRGRTITHVHFFDLKLDHLPEITGSDDAAEAAWIPISKLESMEEAFFEDHFHIIDYFLNVSFD